VLLKHLALILKLLLLHELLLEELLLPLLLEQHLLKLRVTALLQHLLIELHFKIGVTSPSRLLADNWRQCIKARPG
jgi:hypothetical protein